jgi:hypothetical protein
MDRPDQLKFDSCAHPLEALDGQLDCLSPKYGFQIDRNLNRQPCRVLQMLGNPYYLVDISYDDYWVETEFRPDLPLSITLIAYYTPSDKDDFTWKMTAPLAAHVRFTDVERAFPEHLEHAFKLITSWDPKHILQEGQRCENLRKRYYGVTH